MISQNFQSYTDHRDNFFVLIEKLVINNFEVFLKIDSNNFKTIIDCILWEIKHCL